VSVERKFSNTASITAPRGVDSSYGRGSNGDYRATGGRGSNGDGDRTPPMVGAVMVMEIAVGVKISSGTSAQCVRLSLELCKMVLHFGEIKM
jgi:hypothetical protein